jgi:anthranilate synthase/aminodeoxychorismate synthase-like glutamine amidotransferase
MILYVDHYDSFTNNLISWFEAKNANLNVIAFDKLDSVLSFEGIKGIIFSPGPGHPSEYKMSLDFYKKIPPEIPFLGVCLGHQLFLLAEGGNICQISQKPIHGRQIHIYHINQSNYFRNNDLKGTFVLYNSLGCKKDDPIFTKNIIAIASDNSFILVAEHKANPRIGVQFHPESFASPGGSSILNTFLRLVSC